MMCLVFAATDKAVALDRPYFPTIGNVLGATSIKVPVLVYHYVRPLPKDDKRGEALTVTPEAFKQQVSFMLQEGYNPITPRMLFLALRGVIDLPEKPIMLTFDDGTADYVATIAPILASYAVPSTVFVIPGFVNKPGYLTWKQISSLGSSSLVTIGGHGLNHVNLPELQNDIARRQLVITKNVLTMMSGQDVSVFAYPNGVYSSNVTKMLGHAGYNLGFTTERSTLHSYAARFTLPRIRAGVSVGTLQKALEKY